MGEKIGIKFPFDTIWHGEMGKEMHLVRSFFTKEMLMARHCAFHIGRARVIYEKEPWWIRLDQSKCFYLNMKEGCR